MPEQIRTHFRQNKLHLWSGSGLRRIVRKDLTLRRTREVRTNTIEEQLFLMAEPKNMGENLREATARRIAVASSALEGSAS